jgi:S-formylglutathione hydrolase FrmB
VERHAANTDLAIVMPNAHRSYYTDMARGGRYWTFVSEELPRIARAFFPLSERCEENFVAGFSMGGYGAFKLALRCPEKFAAAASISGVFDLSGKTATENPEEKKEFENIFGDLNKIRGSENDLFKLAENLAKSSGPKRKLYQCCGKSDSLFPQNAQFAKHVKRLGLDFTYEEGPGDHDWGYVDQQIQRILKWLPL